MSWLVPSPASLKETVSVPLGLRVALALTKWGSCATAAVAIMAIMARARTSAAVTRRIAPPFFGFLPVWRPGVPGKPVGGARHHRWLRWRGVQRAGEP